MGVACGKRGFEVNEGDNRITVPVADMEQDSWNAALSKNGASAFDSCVNILVISYRRLNHDTDGVSVKAVLDGLVHAGILADDSSKQVKTVTFESRKTGKGEAEKTIIEITDLTEKLKELEG